MDPDPENSQFIVTYLIVLFILLILSAFFSLSETAYTSSNLIKLENQAKKSKSAKLALKICNKYDHFLNTVLVGNNIVNIAAATMATLLFVKTINEDIGPTIATIVDTIVVLIFGEVFPKSIARERPEGCAKFCAYPLYIFSFIFYPITIILVGVSWISKKIFKEKDKNKQLTEEEFSMLVEDMNEDGVLNDIEEDIIQNTIEYGDCKVKEVMTPAKSVHYIKDSDSLETIKHIFADSNYSRLVVCKTNSIQSAYGVIHQKDLFNFLVKKDTNLSNVIMTDIIITKPNNKISRLLKKFQSEHQHMAIVKDNNKVIGIVTMEDILEELVGEIEDETDDD